MPKDPSGNFTLIPTYFAQPGTTIRVEQYNPVVEDIAQAISSSLDRAGRNGMVGNLDMGSFRITNLAPGAAATDAATVGQGVPIGTVVDFAAASIPEGWLVCHGQAVSRSTYAALFAVIGTTYGAGNGSTTFNLPDTRGRVIAGADTSGSSVLAGFFGATARTLGGLLGAASHILTVAQMPNHNHGGSTTPNGGHDHSISTRSDLQGGGGSSAYALTGPSSSTGVNAVANHTHTISSQGGGDAHTNAQPTLIMNKIIRASF